MNIEDKLSKMLRSKPFAGIECSEKQKTEIIRLLEYIRDTKQCVIKPHIIRTTLPKMLDKGVDSFLLERLRRAARINKTGITLYKSLVLYGAAGYDVWNTYRSNQAQSNTFEYKKEKHGMTKAEFDEYNQSRSNCLENFVRRYGEAEGHRKWDAYRKLQSNVGVTLEYFIEKYGEVEGREMFDNIKLRKSHSVEGVLARKPHLTYSEAVDEVVRILQRNKASGYSLKSQRLFWDIYNQLSEDLQDKCYFAELNHEFGRYDHTHQCYRKYDFTITSLKLIIEFNGDYFHAKPGKYKPDDTFYFSSQTASDIWKQDRHKRMLVEDIGYQLIVVWESDYDREPELTTQRCLDAINAA